MVLHRRGCENWSPSYNSGMARPIVIKLVLMEQIAMNITRFMGGVHLHGERAYPFMVSSERHGCIQLKFGVCGICMVV